MGDNGVFNLTMSTDNRPSEKNEDEDDLELELELDDDEEDENKQNEQGSVNNHNHKEFNDALTECLTISKSKISIVTQLSMKYLNRYKDIVHLIEKFIRKGKTLNNTKLPQLFIIDSICRAEIKDNNDQNQTKFIKRFGRNIEKTFHALCRGPDTDKVSIERVFTLWNKEKWFPNDKMIKIINIIKEFKISKNNDQSIINTEKEKKHKHSHHKKHHKHHSHHKKTQKKR